MTKDQRIVAVGAASGIVSMIFLVWFLSTSIDPPAVAEGSADRLAYAIPWLVLAVLPLFAMIVTVGNARFAGQSIDPTRHKEDARMQIDGRVTENTVQQFIIFAVGLLALSVLLPASALSVIPAVTVTFVVARIVFWFGYRLHPLYRAPGFSSTAYLNLGMVIASLWLWLR